MKRVFTDDDGVIIATHDVEQNVQPEAYAAEGRTVRAFVLSDDQIPVTVRDPATGLNIMAQLPADLMAAYVAPVPDRVTSTQGKLALLEQLQLEAFEAVIAAIDNSTDRRAAQLRFDAAEWRRADAMWNQLGAALDPPLSPAQIDDLFRWAAEE